MAHCITYIYLYILTTTTSALVEKEEVRYITERSANGLTENTENPQTQLGGKIARRLQPLLDFGKQRTDDH